ncbi:MAG: hypothetical protein A3E78_08960 [Alphaproteobacteria bacterium RIFCSPHIGHO2_12_FULL_63_12]|nr:MAG: hypothetical protein A3E78_08960 [Alphaproteobacteria bacterium RIFCSPHIGHO2_12_FULL_63_12]
MARKLAVDREVLGAVRLETGRTVDEELKSIQAMARLLDSRFELMGIRFGADAIVGLVPVLGDAVTLLAGSAALATSMRLRLPWHVHARIAGNLVTDAAIGAVPLLGDAFDLFFRSHKRNFRLVERHVLKRAAAQSKTSG